MIQYNTVKQLYGQYGYGQFFREGPNEMNLIGIRGYSDVQNAPGIYNDIIAVAYITDSNENVVEEFIASVDPGIITQDHAMNKSGVAHLIDGYLYWYHLDTRFATYFVDGKFVKTNYRCMRHYGASVPVWRDANFDGNIDSVEMSMESNGSGILIHYGGEDQQIGRASCRERV